MEPTFPIGRRVRVQYSDQFYTVTLEDAQENKADSQLLKYKNRVGVVIDRKNTQQPSENSKEFPGASLWSYKVEFKSGHKIYWVPEWFLEDVTMVGQLY